MFFYSVRLDNDRKMVYNKAIELSELFQEVLYDTRDYLQSGA